MTWTQHDGGTWTSRSFVILKMDEHARYLVVQNKQNVDIPMPRGLYNTLEEAKQAVADIRRSRQWN